MKNTLTYIFLLGLFLNILPVKAISPCSQLESIYASLSLKIYQGYISSSSGTPVTGTELDAAKPYYFAIDNGSLNLEQFGIKEFTWRQFDLSSTLEQTGSGTRFTPLVSFDNLGEKIISVSSSYACISAYDDSVTRGTIETSLGTVEVVSNIPENIRDANQKINSANNTIGFELINKNDQVIDEPYFTYQSFKFRFKSNSDIDTSLINNIKYAFWDYSQDGGSTKTITSNKTSELLQIDNNGSYSVTGRITFVTSQELTLNFPNPEFTNAIDIKIQDKVSSNLNSIRISKNPNVYTLKLSPTISDLNGKRFSIQIENGSFRKLVKTKPIVIQFAAIDEETAIKLNVQSYNKLNKYERTHLLNEMTLILTETTGSGEVYNLKINVTNDYVQ